MLFRLFLTTLICVLLIPLELSAADEDVEEMLQRRKDRMDYSIRSLGSANEMLVEQSVFALELLGEEAVPPLVRELTDRSNDDRLRLNVIYALGRIGPKAKRAVVVLIPFLRHLDDDFRGAATFALGKIGPDAHEAVPALAKRLQDPSTWVRTGAERALLAIRTEEAMDAIREYRRQSEANKNNYSKDNPYRKGSNG
ncbi:MAG: HEAT repeat domain-containing protein [Hyphomicrobiales bacterium]|nr:HEAT repeat domain-containing protein [Hyphomicrobiales bacterium]